MRERVKDRPFSILYLSRSVNEAVTLRSQLRNQGLQASVNHAVSLEDAIASAAKASPTLVVIDFPGHAGSLLDRMAHEPDAQAVFEALPKIVLCDLNDDTQILPLYDLGAEAVVTAESRLMPVLLRTLVAAQTAEAAESYRKQLASAEMRCQKLIDGSSEAVAYLQDGLHIYGNRAYLDLMGFDSLDDLLEEPLLDRAIGESAGRLKTFLREEEGTDEFELRTEGGDKIKVIIASSRATFDGEACLQLFFSRKQNTSAEVEEQLEFFARRDLLTGLYNRNYFFDQLHERLEALRDDETEQGILLMLDITNHEALKKLVGTTGVDSLLTEYGKELEALVGGRGLVARHGAYSFLMLLGKADVAQGEATAKSLLSFTKDYIFTVGTISATVMAAIGLVLLDSNSPQNGMELVVRAERAASKAAERGTNEMELFKPDLRTASDQELEESWARRIKDALKENRFKLAFQPIVSLQGRREINRYEVFLRMLDDQGNALRPLEFLSRAERGDLMGAIDRWVVLNAMKLISDAQRRGEKIRLYVRVSEQSLRDNDFGQWLMNRLAGVRLEESSLIIQVRAELAGYLLKHLEMLRDTIAPLGCSLLIDGFGEGPDSFRLLDHLKTREIKVSRTLLERFSQEAANQAAVTKLLNEANARSIEVIVPNVEDPATLQLLWPMGVDLVQGDFIQSPRDSLEFDFSQF
ncbi:EAL domain-containing protein [Halothiobacillus sp. DCM-1]|uniref:EAL domain-containing protein n=1 Tax=Halothiobacillus sp. DCM-1 TaxID=3112558 RepID=UPI0032554DB2